MPSCPGPRRKVLSSSGRVRGSSFCGERTEAYSSASDGWLAGSAQRLVLRGHLLLSIRKSLPFCLKFLDNVSHKYFSLWISLPVAIFLRQNQLSVLAGARTVPHGHPGANPAPLRTPQVSPSHRPLQRSPTCRFINIIATLQ